MSDSITITTGAEFAGIKQRAAAELRAIADEARELNHRWANACLAFVSPGEDEKRLVQASAIGYHLGSAARELRALAKEVEKL